MNMTKAYFQHERFKQPVVPQTFVKAEQLFVEYKKKQQRRPETIRGYLVDLKQFREQLIGTSNTPVFISQINEAAIEQFVEVLKQKGITPKSINRKLNSISSFCDFAVKQSWLSYNPAKEVERLKTVASERSFLTVDEVQKIIQNLSSPIIKYVVILMSNTGLRINEAISLKLDDVDLKERVIHVIDGKGGKDRDVPISEALVVELEYYLENVRPEVFSLYFFATQKTGRISQQYINRELKETASKLGINKIVTSHVLRHTFASQLVKADVHVSFIQRILGHADVRTTSIYMHADQSDLQAAVNSLNMLSKE